MSAQRLLFPDVDESELQAGWQPLVDIPKGGGIMAADVLNVLAARHGEDGWNGRPGRWVFLREVPAATGSYGESQRFDGLAIGLVPSNHYGRIVYEVKVSRSDWLRELQPKTILRFNGHRAPHATEMYRGEDGDRMADLGYSIEEQAKWTSANKRERVRQYGNAVTPPVMGIDSRDGILTRCIESLMGREV